MPDHLKGNIRSIQVLDSSYFPDFIRGVFPGVDAPEAFLKKSTLGYW
jgi:hypothetical protein